MRILATAFGGSQLVLRSRLHPVMVAGLVSAGLAACVARPPELRAMRDQPHVAASAPRAFPPDAYVRGLVAERLRHNGVGIVVGMIDRDGRRIIAHGRRGSPAPAVEPVLRTPVQGDGPPAAGVQTSVLSRHTGRSEDTVGLTGDVSGDSIFHIGSVTKVLTGLLLADMVARGEVSLDDPASLYLPDGVAMPRRGREITLLDLATHRSGLPAMPTHLSLQARPDPYSGYTVDDLYQFLEGHRLGREPGSEAAYSNLGVALLGRLLARRAGIDYEELLQRRVLRPIGMHSSAITLLPAQLSRLAHGHDRDLRPVRTLEMREMPASGSLRSTAGDMLAFLALYLGEGSKPLQRAAQLQLREGVTSGTGHQALGWYVRPDGVAVHADGKQGYRSAVALDLATRRGIVVLANARTDDQPMALALHLLTGSPLPSVTVAPRRTVQRLPTRSLVALQGAYRTDAGDVINVARYGDHLWLHTPGQGVWEFFPSTHGRFFLNTGNDELSFRRDAREGDVLIWYGDGTEDGEVTLAKRID